MKVFLWLSLCLLPCALFSQKVSEKWVHGYLDLGYEERHLPPYINGLKTYTNEHFELGFRNISLGYYKLSDKGVYQEISLTRLQFEEEDDLNMVIVPPLVNEPSDGERTYTSGLGVQFESGFTTRQWMGGFFRPGIGLGAAPELSYFRYIPKISQRFPHREFSALLGLNLVPRLHFRISERVALMAVVPVRVGTAELSYVQTEDPALTEEQRTTNNLNFDLKLGLEFARIGAAVKL